MPTRSPGWPRTSFPTLNRGDHCRSTTTNFSSESMTWSGPYPVAGRWLKQFWRVVCQVIDRSEPRHRPLVAAVGDRGADPVPRLLQRGVGQADQMHAWQTRGDIGLDPHDLAVQS